MNLYLFVADIGIFDSQASDAVAWPRSYVRCMVRTWNLSHGPVGMGFIWTLDARRPHTVWGSFRLVAVSVWFTVNLA